MSISAVTSLIANDSLNYRDKITKYTIRWASGDPPYTTDGLGAATDIPTLSSAVTGFTISTLTTDTDTGETVITATGPQTWVTDEHYGKWVKILKSGETYLYRITSNTATEVHVATIFAPILDGIVATDTFDIDNEVRGVVGGADGWTINRARQSLAATLDMQIGNDELGVYTNQIREMDLIKVEQRMETPTVTGDWITLGWFLVDNVDTSNMGVSIAARDAMKLGLLDVWSGKMQPDKIILPYPINDNSYIKIKDDEKIDKTDYWLFVDSPEAVDAPADDREINHTFNWAPDPAPQIYKSATYSSLLTAGDELLEINGQDTLVLFGLGEIRIAKEAYDASKPHLKLRYTRYGNYTDIRRMQVLTGISDDGSNATIVLDPQVAMSPQKYAYCSVRFVTGNARYQSFPVSENDESTLTLVGIPNATAGDRFEIVNINPAHWAVVDRALDVGFQALNSAKPFYINPITEVLLDRAPYNDGVPTTGVSALRTYDGTTALYSRQENMYRDNFESTDPTPITILAQKNDFIYIGDVKPFSGLNWTVVDRITPTPAFTNYSVEYYSASAGGWLDFALSDPYIWEETDQPSGVGDGGTNGVALLCEDGRWRWNIPEDWGVTTIDTDCGPFFWIRIQAPTDDSTPPQIENLFLCDPVQGPIVEKKMEDNTKHFDVLEEYRPFVPAVFIWRVNEDNQLVTELIRQKKDADYILDRIVNVAKSMTDADIYTKVVYRAIDENERQNYATLATFTDEAPTYSFTDGDSPVQGIDCLNDGYIRSDFSTMNSGTDDNAGDATGNIIGWGSVGGGAATSMPEDEDVIIFSADLGEIKENIEELRIHLFSAEDRDTSVPHLRVEVRSDVGLPWNPICNKAFSFPETLFADEGDVGVMGRGKWTLYFNSADANWQDTWRYIRFTKLAGDDQTHAFLEIQIFSSSVVEFTSEIGTTAPFTTAFYTALKKRLRSRTYVTPFVDDQSRNNAEAQHKALLTLRELARYFDRCKISAVRPDAKLFQTFSLTPSQIKELQFVTGATTFMIEDISIQRLGVCSVGDAVSYL